MADLIVFNAKGGLKPLLHFPPKPHCPDGFQRARSRALNIGNNIVKTDPA